MTINNLLNVKSRDELREWLMQNHDNEPECWVVVKRGRLVDDGTFWYVDVGRHHIDVKSKGPYNSIYKVYIQYCNKYGANSTINLLDVLYDHNILIKDKF
jgi:hypothetical protein